MRFIRLMTLAGALGLAGCGPVERGAAEDGEAPQVIGDFTTDTHDFDEVADGVYFVRYTASGFNSNSLVIVGDEDVILVDSHITPATARELLASIRRVTDNPIGVVINTHFHYDHAHGNQAFPAARVVGHTFTRQKMAGAPLEEKTFQSHLLRTKAAAEQLQAAVAAAATEDERQGAETQLAAAEAHLASLEEVAPVPPNVVLEERMTLYRGDREIQVVFCGRGHTGGDVVVVLPNDRLVFTGDLLLGGPSWLGDGYVDEWPATLENLKAVVFPDDVILPGHGPKFKDPDHELIRAVQDFYRELWAQVDDLRRRGKSIEDAAAEVDLRHFEERLPGRRLGFDPQAVARMYERHRERQARAAEGWQVEGEI